MRKALGIICLILAIAFFFGGIGSISKPLPSGLADTAGYSVGHYVGSFIPCIVALMLGLLMFKKKDCKDEEN
jgi:hypothetical protein